MSYTNVPITMMKDQHFRKQNIIYNVVFRSDVSREKENGYMIDVGWCRTRAPGIRTD